MLRPTYSQFINDTPLEYLPVNMPIIHWGLGSPSGSKRFRKAKKLEWQHLWNSGLKTAQINISAVEIVIE